MTYRLKNAFKVTAFVLGFGMIYNLTAFADCENGTATPCYTPAEQAAIDKEKEAELKKEFERRLRAHEKWKREHGGKYRRQ